MQNQIKTRSILNRYHQLTGIQSHLCLTLLNTRRSKIGVSFPLRYQYSLYSKQNSKTLWKRAPFPRTDARMFLQILKVYSQYVLTLHQIYDKIKIHDNDKEADSKSLRGNYITLTKMILVSEGIVKSYLNHLTKICTLKIFV